MTQIAPETPPTAADAGPETVVDLTPDTTLPGPGHKGPTTDAAVTAAAARIDEAVDKLTRVTPKPIGFGARLGKGLRRLGRWLVILAVVAGIAAAGYFGWPIIDDRVVKPIASNTEGVSAIQQRVDATEAQLSAIEAEIGSLTSAGSTLPERLTAAEAAIAGIAETQTVLDGRVGAVEDAIAGHSEQLQNLDELQAALGADLASTISGVGDQLAMLRSMELLSRARLFLYQANYGLAIQDLTAARSVLSGISDSSAIDAAVITETVFRLDLALAALPDRPVAASDDLDIAWQVLLGQVPAVPLAAETSEATTESVDE